MSSGFRLRKRVTVRSALVAAVLLCVLPAVVSGTTYEPVDAGSNKTTSLAELNGTTVVSTQGSEVSDNGELLICNDDGRVVWQVTTLKHPYDAE